MGFKMKGFPMQQTSALKSDSLTKAVKTATGELPKVKYFDSERGLYSPEENVISLPYGPYNLENIKKQKRHEYTHSTQKDVRERFFKEREAYLQEKKKKYKHPTTGKGWQKYSVFDRIKDRIKGHGPTFEQDDLLEDWASRYQSEQYNIPGTLEYEARQSEDKPSPIDYKRKK